MLPPLLPGWRATYLADGVQLVPPGGGMDGAIRIRDRRRPLRAVRDLVSARISELRLEALDVTAIERVTTCEGELAALVTIHGTVEGAPVARHLGFVFGDDFYTQIDTATWTPARTERTHDLVREVVTYYPLGLGAQRRRRFWYRPPAGWIGYPRGLITEWYSPAFPGSAAGITVMPARPISTSPTSVLDCALHELNWAGFVPTEVGGSTPLATHGHLGGAVHHLTGRSGDGPELHHDVAVLGDDRFLYVVRLASPVAQLPAHRPLLAALVDSIEPVPSPMRGAALQTLDHWAD